MARLWASGFEINSTTGFDEWHAYNNVSISSAIKRSGKYALRANPSSSISSITHLFKYNPANDKFYVRFYFYATSLPDALTPIFSFYDNSSNRGMNIRLTSGGVLRLYSSSGSQLGSDGSTLSTGQWYRIEIFGGYGVVNSFEVRLDGSTDISATFSTSSQAVSQIRFGILDTASADVYFDDIAINDTSGSSQNSWPGEGRIVCLMPNGNGDINNWSAVGAASRYQCVDERTPDDDTTYIISTTSNGVQQLFDCQSMEEAGADNVDTVTLVGVGCVIGNARAYMMCKEGGTTDVATVSEYYTTGYNAFWFGNLGEQRDANYNIMKYTKPSGGAWTESTVNSMQIGAESVGLSGGARTRITTIWAMVEWIRDTDLEIVLGDTQNLSDNLNRAWETSKTLADSMGLSDDDLVSRGLPDKLLSDSIFLSEQFAPDGVDMCRDVTDPSTFAITDSIAFSAVKNLSDLFSLADLISKKTSLLFSDTVDISDNLDSTVLGHIRNYSDTINLADSLQKLAGIKFSDEILFSDTLVKTTGKTLSEIIDIVDSISQTTGKNLADSFDIADALVLKPGRRFSDTVDLNDDLIKATGKPLSDLVDIADSLSSATGKTLSDAFDLADDIVKITGLNLSESFDLADSLVALASNMLYDSVGITDDITEFQVGKFIGDNFDLTDEIAHSTGKNLADSLLISDALVSTFLILPSDTFDLNDEVVKTTGLTLNDLVSFSDSLTRFVEFSLSLADSISLADAISKESGLTLADSFGLADTALTFFAKKILAETLLISDEINTKTVGKVISDSFDIAEQIVLSTGLNLSDVFSLADTISNIFTGKIFSEIIDITDALVKVSIVNKSETVDLNDLVEKVSGKPFSDTVSIADSTEFGKAATFSDAIIIADVLTEKAIGLGISSSIDFTDVVLKTTGKTLSDLVDILDATSSATGLTISDTFLLADEITTFGKGTIISDSLNIIDALAKTYIKPIIDQIEFADNLEFLTQKYLSDTLGIADIVATALGRDLSDQILLVDLVSKATGLPISDAVDLLDTSTSVIGRNLSDNITFSDNFEFLKNVFAELSDSVTLADAFSGEKGFIREFSDTLTFTDSLVSSLVDLLDKIYINKRDIYSRKRDKPTNRDDIYGRKRDLPSSKDDIFNKKVY